MVWRAFEVSDSCMISSMFRLRRSSYSWYRLSASAFIIPLLRNASTFLYKMKREILVRIWWTLTLGRAHAAPSPGICRWQLHHRLTCPFIREIAMPLPYASLSFLRNTKTNRRRRVGRQKFSRILQNCYNFTRRCLTALVVSHEDGLFIESQSRGEWRRWNQEST